jgi:hypothetical protein
MRFWPKSEVRRRNLAVLVFSVIPLMLTSSRAMSQIFAGEAIPVVQRTDPPQLLRFRFLALVFGREGPMDTALASAPVMGHEYLVEANLHGVESAASVRFQLIDMAGRELQTITMWKATDSSTEGDFYGIVTVPNQPFRAVVLGTATNGSAIRSAFGSLFQPASNGVDLPLGIPQGVPVNQAAGIQKMMDEYREQLHAQSKQAAAANPDGTINLTRNVVSPIRYEPLNSTSGVPIGIRLHYSIRFPTQQTVRGVPHMFPEYALPAWRGVVSMKPLTGSITPAPSMIGVQSLPEVVQYEAAATYQAGVTYSFTIDMVPDFVFQGTQTGRFCLFNQKVLNREIWNALISSSDSVSYSVSIADTGTSARIPASYSQRTFHESFVASGAGDCGAVPNVRF